MCDDLYFISIEGATEETLEHAMSELDDTGAADNIVVTSEQVEPIDRTELKVWLQQLANELDMTLVDNG